MSKTLWMQEAAERMREKGTVGALRRQLGVKEGEKIPMKLLQQIVKAPIGSKVGGRTVTRQLKRRAVFALVAKRVSAKRRRKK